MFNFFKSQNNKITKIFIVGCGHSGTSIMLSLLDNHDYIQAIPNETGIFFKSNKEIKTFFQRTLEEAKLNNKRAIVEKTPRHVDKIDQIIRIYPEAKIIVMIRDGRDVACSIKERTGDFKEGIDRWIKSNENAFNFFDNLNVQFIKLEDLVAKPQKTMKFVFEFIDIDFSPDVFSKQGKDLKSYYHNKKTSKKEIENTEKYSHERHMKNRNWQINQGLFKSTKRWDNEMTNEELEYFYENAEVYLHKYGYTK